jgi:hypothetical protein
VSSNAPADVAFEVTTLRPYYEQWHALHEDRNVVVLSGIDQRRFRGAIRFLEAYARGEDASMREQPDGVNSKQFRPPCRACVGLSAIASCPAATPFRTSWPSVELDNHRSTVMGKALARVSELLHQAAETHHLVFAITDGEDADWATWSSDWLVNLSDLRRLPGTKPMRSELTYLLVGLDKEYVRTTPCA